MVCGVPPINETVLRPSLMLKRVFANCTQRTRAVVMLGNGLVRWNVGALMVVPASLDLLSIMTTKESADLFRFIVVTFIL